MVARLVPFLSRLPWCYSAPASLAWRVQSGVAARLQPKERRARSTLLRALTHWITSRGRGAEKRSGLFVLALKSICRSEGRLVLTRQHRFRFPQDRFEAGHCRSCGINSAPLGAKY